MNTKIKCCHCQKNYAVYKILSDEGLYFCFTCATTLQKFKYIAYIKEIRNTVPVPLVPKNNYI